MTPGVNTGRDADLTAYHRRFLWVLPLALLWLWVRPLASSLWIDELGTWWVVKGSFAETVRRSWEFQGQSPLYYVIAWLAGQVSPAEWVLRLPSLVAACIGALLLHRLARRLLDLEYARLAVLAFVAWPGVAFEASNARPYAIAVTLTIGSFLALAGWLDTASPRRAVLYVLVTSAVVYAHYLFALALIPQLLYAVNRVREHSTEVRPRHLAGSAAALAVLEAPLVVQVLSLLSRRQSLTIPGEINVTWLTERLAPPTIVAALVLGMVAAWAYGRIAFQAAPLPPTNAALVLGWLLVPVLTLAGAALVSNIRFLEWRYTLVSAPAGCLLVAWVVRAIEPDLARRLVAALFALFTALSFPGTLKGSEDWRWARREVLAARTGRTTVVYQSGHIESNDLRWLDEPDKRSYLLSPDWYYDLPGPTVLLPRDFGDAATRWAAPRLDAIATRSDTIVFLSPFLGAPYAAWLEGRLGGDGWARAPIRARGSMLVIAFHRPPGGAAPARA